MAEKKDFASILPDKAPEGLLSWLKEKGVFNKEMLVYKLDYYRDPITGLKEKVCQCKCTACGSVFYESYSQFSNVCNHNSWGDPYGFWDELTKQHIHTGVSFLCRECNAPVEAVRATSYGVTKTIARVYPLTVEMVDGVLCLITWCVEKMTDREANATYRIHKYDAFCFDGRRVGKCVAYSKNMGSIGLLGKWENRTRLTDDGGSYDYIFPFDKRILNGTPLENCKLDKYIKDTGQI